MPETFTETDPRGKKVLLVDDDEGIRNLLELIVSEEGFHVICAESGEEAIDKLAQKPDAVVMDLVMPGCGGLGVLKHFKENGGPIPPIIVLTAYENRHPMVQAAVMDPNVVQCLAKPMDHNLLMEALHRYLKTEPLAEGQRKHSALALDPTLSEAILASKVEDNEFFKGFGAKPKAALLADARTQTFDRGAPIFKEGEVADAVYLVCAGEVELIKESIGSRAAVLSVVAPGDYFGEIAILDNSGRNIGARARAAVTVQKLPAQAVSRALASEPPETTLRLTKRLLKYLRATNERLIAEIVLKEKMKIVGALAGSILNDCRSPLAAIQSGAHEVIRLHQDEATVAHCRQIQAQAARMFGAAQELVNFATGTPSLRKKPVAIGNILETFRQLNTEYLRKSFVQLNLKPAEADVNVDLDKILLALQNILANAVAGFGEKGGEVTIASQAVNGVVEITMSDNGPGLPEAARRRLFDPLAADGASGRSGMGMAIAKSLVEAHGGKLELKSAPGTATVFSISLPKG